MENSDGFRLEVKDASLEGQVQNPKQMLSESPAEPWRRATVQEAKFLVVKIRLGIWPIAKQRAVKSERRIAVVCETLWSRRDWKPFQRQTMKFC